MKVDGASAWLGWVPVWRRNFLVWRKLAIPSLLGNFGDPLLYLLGIGYGLGALVGDVGGMPYVMFFASGLVCSSAMNTASFEGMYSAFTRMSAQRTWDAILATPLRIEDVVLGEIVWAATKSLISSSAILVVAVLLGAVASPWALAALPIIFLTGLVFGAIALFMTALAPSYDFFMYYFTLVVTPMFLFSGVFFPVATLPPVMQSVASLLPLTHAVAAVRPLMTGAPTDGISTHLVVLGLFFGAFAVAACTVTRRRFAK
jgi:lipooligosaccharide transport system permease protein